MSTTQQVCLSSDPRALRKTPICMHAVSKDLRGELHLLDRELQRCEDEECETLKTDHNLKAEVQAHEPCDSRASAALDGTLLVRRLITAFSDGSGEQRGPHTGQFEWLGQAATVEGSLAGMTNVGTHREPAFDPCQKCHDPGYMEGRLCGRITKAQDRRLVGAEVTAVYRFRFDPSEGAQDTGIRGTLEGVIIRQCGRTGSDCLDLTGFTVGSQPNPWSVGGHDFHVHDHTGTPTATAEVVSWGGVTGLNAGYETRITLGAAVTTVDITLAHFSSPATVTAFDGGGGIVDSATMTLSGTPETLHLSGPGIATLVVEASNNETLILEVCVA